MMLRYSFDMPAEAQAIENAVSTLLDEGYRTADIMPSESTEIAKCKKIGCHECGRLIAEFLTKEK